MRFLRLTDTKQHYNDDRGGLLSLELTIALHMILKLNHTIVITANT